MKTKIKILLCGIAITFASCDFLEVEPRILAPEKFFNNEAQASSFLTGCYAPLISDSFYGGSYILNCASGDDLGFYERNNPVGSILCANANTDNAQITSYWRLNYEGINRTNMMLEGIDKPKMPEATREQFRSEARVLRAFYYFQLVQSFGDVPFKTQSTDRVNNLNLPRISKDTIYNFIAREIEMAVPALKKSNELNYTGRLTQSAAQAILARVYLFRAGEHLRDHKSAPAKLDTYFSQASYWAQQVRNSGLHKLNPSYEQVFRNLCGDKYNEDGYLESIWEAEFSGNRITNTEHCAGRLGNIIGLGGPDLTSSSAVSGVGGLQNPGYGYYFLMNTNKLYEMYQANSDYERRYNNIAHFDYVVVKEAGVAVRVSNRAYDDTYEKTVVDPNTGISKTYSIQTDPGVVNTTKKMSTVCRKVAKYRREWENVLPKNKNFTPINFPIIRYSDVLLMIAEAEARRAGGDMVLAHECLNEVRKRAMIEPKKGLSPEELFNAVKDERAMELCFEGTRRYDLIRWGEYLTAMEEIKNVYFPKENMGTNYTSRAEYFNIPDSYVYFPIPDAERATNKLILFNNPGW